LDSKLNLNGVRIFGGLKSFQWFGSQVGNYYSVRAPSGRCLGDVRMRTIGSGISYLCLRFNAYKCLSCGLNQRTVCDKYGRKPHQCSLKQEDKKCSSGSYKYTATSGVQTCLPCKRCSNAYLIKKPCSGTQNTVCLPVCASGYYLDLRNGRCHRCTRCSWRYVQVSSCTKWTDTVCKVQRCLVGTYKRRYRGGVTCKPCTHCNYPYVTRLICTPTQDTVCGRVCMPGYYQRYGRCHRCTRCRKGYRLITRCTKTQDTVCRYCSFCQTPSLLSFFG